MKCNPDPHVVSTLAKLGAGFDCASAGEIDQVLGLGVPTSHIAFGHPSKQNAHVTRAAAQGIEVMMFDGDDELRKVAALYPTAKMVLRLATDDSHAQCRLSNKFGAQLAAVPHLLDVAAELGVDVVGISYHVGSGTRDIVPYLAALKQARDAFDIAASKGVHFRLLDIGGGFPGWTDEHEVCSALGLATSAPTFEHIGHAVAQGITYMFPDAVMPGQSSGTLPAAGSGVRVIAEPGRYMVSDSHTLATTVMGRRTVKDEGEDARMYYVNDSLYGSFNCLIFDHGVIDAVHVPHATVAAGFEATAAALVFSPATKLRYDDGHAKPAESEPGFVPQGGLPEIPFEGPVMRSSLWGQTCDGMDCLMRKAVMPKMEIGDHLVCHTMGAYTTAAGTNFNGFESPDRVYLENGEVIDAR